MIVFKLLHKLRMPFTRLFIKLGEFIFRFKQMDKPYGLSKTCLNPN